MMSTYALWRPNGVSGSLVCDQVTANVVDGGGAESAFLVVGQYVSWVARVSDIAEHGHPRCARGGEVVNGSGRAHHLQCRERCGSKRGKEED